MLEVEIKQAELGVDFGKKKQKKLSCKNITAYFSL